MVDIHTIIQGHRPRRTPNSREHQVPKGHRTPTTSEIPDLFFDDVLVFYKLSRIEIMALMYLYRRVWCRPNLYKEYGISQLLSHTEMANVLGITIDDVHNASRKLEGLGFISVIRSGQYFVRKYFTKENDEKYGQTYDDFEI